jgi:hypothetical protein
LALPYNRLGDQLFGFARTVHLRHVDVGHAQGDTPLQGLDRGTAAVILGVPGPLTSHRDLAFHGTERPSFHVFPPQFTGLFSAETSTAGTAYRHERCGTGKGDLVILVRPAAVQTEDVIDAEGDAAVGAQRIEADRRGKLGPGRGADVAVESHPALAAADQQVAASVAV